MLISSARDHLDLHTISHPPSRNVHVDVTALQRRWSSVSVVDSPIEPELSLDRVSNVFGHKRARYQPLDEATEKLRRELEASPTDLAKLVKRIYQRGSVVVVISRHATARWHNDDPEAWDRVNDWLTKRGVQIVVDP